MTGDQEGRPSKVCAAHCLADIFAVPSRQNCATASSKFILFYQNMLRVLVYVAVQLFDHSIQQQ